MTAERFVWPPRPAASASTPPETPTEHATPARTPWWWRLERAWLSPTSTTLAQRVAASGWTPEPAGEACDRCGRTVGAFEATEFGCALCAGTRPAWSRAVRLGAYEDELEAWVKEIKFERSWRLGEALGRLLGRRLVEAGFEGVVVPMATTWRRRMSRGTDHALTIARGVSAASGLPLVRALRRAHRPSQRAVGASARKSNVAGAFRARGGAMRRLEGRDAVVIDDVMTSGATMSGACRALRRGWSVEGLSGGSVWCAVLAVTPPRSGPGSGSGSGLALSEAGSGAVEDG